MFEGFRGKDRAILRIFAEVEDRSLGENGYLERTAEDETKRRLCYSGGIGDPHCVGDPLYQVKLGFYQRWEYFSA